MGVLETNFLVKQGVTGTGMWKVYDIRGSRSLRLAWVPFFDGGAYFSCVSQLVLYVFDLLSVDAILFLVPISRIDKRSEEDHRMWCIEDSMLQWREICRNKLLMNVDLILCFDGVDLLQNKLENGVQVNKYLTQYKGPNTLVDVCKCE